MNRNETDILKDIAMKLEIMANSIKSMVSLIYRILKSDKWVQ